MLLQETKIRLSKAIFLRDAFTGEPVSAGIRIHSLSGGRMEKKAGGYFLFLDVDSSEFEIQVESPIYQSRKLWLKKDCGVEVCHVSISILSVAVGRYRYSRKDKTRKPDSVSSGG